ncbi:hypothetical protein Tco_0002397 [Tanacetum coccineum]
MLEGIWGKLKVYWVDTLSCDEFGFGAKGCRFLGSKGNARRFSGQSVSSNIQDTPPYGSTKASDLCTFKMDYVELFAGTDSSSNSWIASDVRCLLETLGCEVEYPQSDIRGRMADHIHQRFQNNMVTLSAQRHMFMNHHITHQHWGINLFPCKRKTTVLHQFCFPHSPGLANCSSLSLK